MEMIRTLILSFFFVFASAPVTWAIFLYNGDFSYGLAGWKADGDVTIDDGGVALGDNGVTYSLLYREIQLSEGYHTLELDFRSHLSGTVPYSPPFAFLDTFFATLYFTNDMSGFNLAPGGFDAALPIFSLDHNGLFDSFATIGASSKGPDWARMRLDFYNGYTYVVPVFELFDMNYVDNDSRVLLDNVEVVQPLTPSAVPEPATFIMAGCGILALIAVRMRGGRGGKG